MRKSLLYSLATTALVLAVFSARMAAAPHMGSGSSASALAATSILPATSTPDTYPVVKVVDGDTVDLAMNGTVTRVRIIGLDTPEIVDPRKPVQCFAREASLEGHQLLDGHYVRVEYEPNDAIDKYGRTLAYIFLQDGTSYEYYMIENGYGHEYTYKKLYRYQQEFRSAEAIARAQKKGFWADDTCGGNTTKPATSP